MQKKVRKIDYSFQFFMKKLPFGDVSKVRHAIFTSCNISRMTFSRWYRGAVKPSKEHRKQLNAIAYQYTNSNIYNYETEKVSS